MNLNIAVLAGDGIGQEVTTQAAAVLETVCKKFSHTLEVKSGLLGGVAIRAKGDPLPEETLTLIKSAGAVLLGAVGHPEFDSYPPEKRPEKGLLRLRQELKVFANLRPAICFPALESLSPLRGDIVRGTNLMTVRELTGGIYYGTPRGIQERNGEITAINTMVYTKKEIERIARVAFKLAQGRKKHVISVVETESIRSDEHRGESLLHRPIPFALNELRLHHAVVVIRLAVCIDLRHAIEDLVPRKARGLRVIGRRHPRNGRQQNYPDVKHPNG